MGRCNLAQFWVDPTKCNTLSAHITGNEQFIL